MRQAAGYRTLGILAGCWFPDAGDSCWLLVPERWGFLLTAGSRTLDGEFFSFWCSVCEKQEVLSFLLTDNACGRTGA